jgi:hypothetical protein
MPQVLRIDVMVHKVPTKVPTLMLLRSNEFILNR